MPRLSVIMPAYNSEKSVGAAIRSTLRSMPGDSELVVLDDASDDDTLCAIQAIEDSRVRVVANNINQGVATNLQLLLESVDSRYVARMDADDLCLPWRFLAQMRFLERHPDVKILFGGAIRFGEGRMPRPTLPVPYRPALSLAMLPLRNPYIHPTMFAETVSVRRAGGYEPGAAEDYGLWARAATRGITMRRLGSPVILYRQHANQVSGQDSYVDKMLSDHGLKHNIDALSAGVYSGVEAGLLWRLLERRLNSEKPLNGVTVQSLRDGLSPDIKLLGWESMYLNRWLRKTVGTV
jgi:hypothetical protein